MVKARFNLGVMNGRYSLIQGTPVVLESLDEKKAIICEKYTNDERYVSFNEHPIDQVSIKGIKKYYYLNGQRIAITLQINAV